MATRRVLLLCCLILPACRDDSTVPYLEFAGGGFVFNYRTADHYYGFVVRQKKPVPEASKIEVHFEVPGGEEVQVQDGRPGQLQYVFQTGNLRGIIKDHPYRVLVMVRDSSGTELARYERAFETSVDQMELPDQPLVIGPGYQAAPKQ